jgi:hypothetical protein
MPTPIYTSESTRAVHNVFLDWTGWLKRDVDNATVTAAIHQCKQSWQVDGISLTNYQYRGGALQILAEATPQVSPEFFAQRVKGRLTHALRQRGITDVFTRKLAVRSLGGFSRVVHRQQLLGTFGVRVGDRARPVLVQPASCHCRGRPSIPRDTQ